jgi:hypothetical protein
MSDVFVAGAVVLAALFGCWATLGVAGRIEKLQERQDLNSALYAEELRMLQLRAAQRDIRSHMHLIEVRAGSLRGLLTDDTHLADNHLADNHLADNHLADNHLREPIMLDRKTPAITTPLPALQSIPTGGTITYNRYYRDDNYLSADGWDTEELSEREMLDV